MLSAAASSASSGSPGTGTRSTPNPSAGIESVPALPLQPPARAALEHTRQQREGLVLGARGERTRDASEQLGGGRRPSPGDGNLSAQRGALAYALPLRFVWVLLGICYFFPGLWKYWYSGLAWAFSDHFKHLAEWKWINMGLEMKDGAWQGDWQPLFRIDLYPLMYKPAAHDRAHLRVRVHVPDLLPAAAATWRSRWASASTG